MFEQWNEFNTFSKYIYPYLENKLGYPERSSKFFDEQTWVRKRNHQKGPYDGVFKIHEGTILLIEAKRYQKKLSKTDEEQATDYALGGDFHPVPPPYLLVSNGNEHRWFKRELNDQEQYFYTRIEEIAWSKARKSTPSTLKVEEYSLKKLIKLLQKVRIKIFDDLTNKYFPNGYFFSNSKLGKLQNKFNKIIDTRQTYIDPELKNTKEELVIATMLSSIALSQTLKILFIKMLSDLGGKVFPEKLLDSIKDESVNYPGILKAEPYDVLTYSNECETELVNWFKSIRITKALIFDSSNNNVLGDIWDGLVQNEENDLQVTALGNVYTPHSIVKAMVDRADYIFKGNWKDKKIMEPSCGSGHFVRECYNLMIKSELGNKHGTIDKLVATHKKVLNNIKAVDIDPFAIQTSQLGMFLELYKSRNLWEKVVLNREFDLSKTIIQHDFLNSDFRNSCKNFEPDLIVGNPPYGVSVTEEVMQSFGLTNKDSYGCFIAQSLNLLKKNGTLLFIVSSSFTTLKTHTQLRKNILLNAIVKSIYLLHRNVFQGRDVFCCFIELLKKKTQTHDTFYFYDAWSLHPKNQNYIKALNNWSSDSIDDHIDETSYFKYELPIKYLFSRYYPPKQTAIVDKIHNASCDSLDYSHKSFEKVYPIVGGLPSLFLYVLDDAINNSTILETSYFPKIGKVDSLKIIRNNKNVSLIKLWQIAVCLQGLATADDATFLRINEGLITNARRRYLKEVKTQNVITIDNIARLTPMEQETGIDVLDYNNDRYFIPFDKGGEQDTKAGVLNNYFNKVEYWIDWSKRSVNLLKKRSSFKTGTHKKSYIRNKDFYFKQGIICTVTGLYAPTFTLSHGSVFGHKANLIFTFKPELQLFLLAILCHPMTKYLMKNFISHGVDVSTDTFRHIPIPVPTDNQFQKTVTLTKQVITKLKTKHTANDLIQTLNDFISNELYKLTDTENNEISTWFKRKYPHFGKDAQSK